MGKPLPFFKYGIIAHVNPELETKKVTGADPPGGHKGHVPPGGREVPQLKGKWYSVAR